MVSQPLTDRFASSDDLKFCRALHRKYGTTYYFATCRFPDPYRDRTHAIYGFVRVVDEWVDNPELPDTGSILERIEAYREEFLNGLNGACPAQPELRAFVDVVRETGMPPEEPLAFLSAMESDLTVNRYCDYDALCRYMRGSAAAVGLMMCNALDTEVTEPIRESAVSLANAMQLTNFLRDVGEDAGRNRIYLPREDMERFGVDDDQILEGRVDDDFRSLMRFEIERARKLYRLALSGIASLPPSAQPAVRLAHVLYSRILDRIEDRDYDVFTGRARTSTVEKLVVAAQTLILGQHRG